MVNERALDVRSVLKPKDGAGNIVDVFLTQVTLRVYDHIISKSVNFARRSEIDAYIGQDEERIEDFKRAIAEQVIYLVSVADLNYILPDGTVNYAQWKDMRICPQTSDILKNMGFLRLVIGDGEMFYKGR
jgi:hypothetical protein